ncbi:MAG TPA: hypothetical protein VD741_03730 [Solirubrobacterales bacterium]|nr:hypothetical protein [Solirubrobacterales bacterium]
MKLRSTICVGLLALVAAAVPAPAAAEAPTPLSRLTPEDFSAGAAAAFEVAGTNGYTIAFNAYSDDSSGKAAIFVSVTRKGEAAVYRWPATVSDAFVRADLGAMGRVDLALRPAGREKTVPIKCSPHTYTYDPGTYEGTIEFEGEGGYTRASATQAPVLPLLSSFCSGGGSGESIGSGNPGARIRGISFADGRKLSFQVNKNQPRAQAVYTAELTKRHDGSLVHRTVEGVAPASAFRWGRKLRTARLSPPAPFSGAAVLRRDPDSISPRWAGDLALDFPGRRVRLAGPGIHVTLVHARFNCSDGGEAGIGVRLRCGL